MSSPTSSRNAFFRSLQNELTYHEPSLPKEPLNSKSKEVIHKSIPLIDAIFTTTIENKAHKLTEKLNKGYTFAPDALDTILESNQPERIITIALEAGALPTERTLQIAKEKKVSEGLFNKLSEAKAT